MLSSNTRFRLSLGFSGLALAAASAAQDPSSLSEQAGCNRCHLAEQQMVGPAWKAIAERYRGTDGAAAILVERSRKGAQGEWGSIPMPAVTTDQLSDGDLTKVIEWILDH